MSEECNLHPRMALPACPWCKCVELEAYIKEIEIGKVEALDWGADLDQQLAELKEELRVTQNAYHSLYKKLEKMSTSHHAAVYIEAKTALREIRNAD